jgi:nitrite reductase (NADH) small subunit
MLTNVSARDFSSNKDGLCRKGWTSASLLSGPVFHTRAGQVFATQLRCPHRGGPLADGLTDDISVVCPLHDRIHDLQTGGGIGTECNIMAYPVRVTTDGTILLVLQPFEAMTATK